MNNTKKEILRVAKKMFNEKGYNAVSVRDIAGEVGIGSGNLTYYFAKKEEIMETLLAESKSEYTVHISSLEAMDEFFMYLQQDVKENSFYYGSHTQLAQVSSVISDKQREMYEENSNVLKEGFLELCREGLIYKESYKGEYDRLIDSLLISITYWIPFCQMKGSIDVRSYRRQAWSVILPIMTKDGKVRLFKLLKK
ncbi:MAG: TetR/AcrR family transcriptional regulator [Clostridiales bacterium]|nr:TetR/AcrR family transcriptional regulator [Clostridiales bacterium]